MCNATGLWMECVCIIDISDNVAKYILWPVSFFHFTLWVKKTTLYSYSYLYQMLIKQFTHNVVRIPRPRKVIHVAFMRLWTLSCICQYYDDFVGVYIYIYLKTRVGVDSSKGSSWSCCPGIFQGITVSALASCVVLCLHPSSVWVQRHSVLELSVCTCIRKCLGRGIFRPACHRLLQFIDERTVLYESARGFSYIFSVLCLVIS